MNSKFGLRICLICGHGGHLSEALRLLPAVDGHDRFIVTYESKFSRSVVASAGVRGLYLEPPASSMSEKLGIPYLIHLAVDAVRELRYFHDEKPDLVISTGSEIAIPMFVYAFLFRRKRIYVESLCRLSSLSLSGKLLMPISNLFLVQSKPLADEYCPKAEFWGSVL